MLNSNESFLYICSWSQKGGKPGLGLYKFNNDTGEITFLKMLNDEFSYGYATFDPVNGILYCAADLPKHPDLRAGAGGCIFAYKADPTTGELTEISQAPTYCPQPSFVSLDPERKFLVASMHSSMESVTKVSKDAFGKICVNVLFSDAGVVLYALNSDGSIGEMLDLQTHSGHGPKPRQLQPHAHSAVFAPQGDLVASCDKGNDGIHMYRIDKDHGKLVLNGGTPYAGRPGRAPRYCAFHPSLPFFFHNNEMEMEIDSYRYDSMGNLEHLSTVRAVPESYSLPEGKRFSQQDFQISPDGKYIYAMMQGLYNGISVFSVDQQTAELTFIQHLPIEGVWARDFSFSPDYKFIVTACLTSGDIASFAIRQDGTLVPTGYSCIQSASNCVAFYNP